MTNEDQVTQAERLATILEGWAKAYRDTPKYRFPSDPDAEFFPVDLEGAAKLLRTFPRDTTTQAERLALAERLQSVVDYLDEANPLPRPYDFYYAVKNDGHETGWRYECVGIGINDIKDIIAALRSLPRDAAPAAGYMNGVIERLRNPMWSHSNAPFESPQLDKEENLAAMREAADIIEGLASAAAEQQKLVDDVLSILYNYRDHRPEEDETWESWYYAAFDLACMRITEKFGRPAMTGEE